MARIQSNTYQGRYLYLDVSEQSYSVADNSSVVKWEVAVVGGTSSFYQVAPTKAVVNGTTVYETTSTTPWNAGKFPANRGSVSGTLTIPHDSDGKKTISFTLSSGIYDGLIYDSSGTLKLTDIPRGSTFTASGEVFVGEAVSISVKKAISTLTHSLKYTFGGLTGYVTESGGLQSSEVKLSSTSFSFAVPDSWYAQFPNASSSTLTLTLTSYSGSTKVGNSTTQTVKVKANQAVCAPVITASVVDAQTSVTKVTGNNQKLVRYASTARCTMTAAGSKYSTIKSMTVNGMAYSSALDFAVGYGTKDFVFVATDSRGYTSTIVVSPEIVEYVKLHPYIDVVRNGADAGTATVTISGSFFNGNFGVQDNEVAVNLSVNGGDDIDVPVTITDDFFVGKTTIEGIAYTNSYSLDYTVTDNIDEYQAQYTIDAGLPIFAWKQHEFTHNTYVRFNDDILIKGEAHFNELLYAHELACATMDVSEGFTVESGVIVSGPLVGLGQSMHLQKNADFNTFTSPGSWGTQDGSIASTFVNAPVAESGRLITWFPGGWFEENKPWQYGVQEFVNLSGHKWFRSFETGSGTTYKFKNWEKAY